jgi:hypothetical protein
MDRKRERNYPSVKSNTRDDAIWEDVARCKPMPSEKDLSFQVQVDERWQWMRMSTG